MIISWVGRMRKMNHICDVFLDCWDGDKKLRFAMTLQTVSTGEVEPSRAFIINQVMKLHSPSIAFATQ